MNSVSDDAYDSEFVLDETLVKEVVEKMASELKDRNHYIDGFILGNDDDVELQGINVIGEVTLKEETYMVVVIHELIILEEATDEIGTYNVKMDIPEELQKQIIEEFK